MATIYMVKSFVSLCQRLTQGSQCWTENNQVVCWAIVEMEIHIYLFYMYLFIKFTGNVLYCYVYYYQNMKLHILVYETLVISHSPILMSGFSVSISNTKFLVSVPNIPRCKPISHLLVTHSGFLA